MSEYENLNDALSDVPSPVDYKQAPVEIKTPSWLDVLPPKVNELMAKHGKEPITPSNFNELILDLLCLNEKEKLELIFYLLTMRAAK